MIELSDFAKVLRIACIGEVMIELSGGDQKSAQLGVAGDTYNTAVYLARLLRGAHQVSYVTALGVDRFSNRIIGHMHENGIDTSFVERRDDRLPGLYAIQTDEQGERSFLYWRSESAARTLFETPAKITLESMSGFDLIYLSGITLAVLPDETRQRLLRFLKQFRASGGLIAYDSNFRPRLWPDLTVARSVNHEMYGLADIALPSFDDERALFGETDPDAVVRRLVKSGVRVGAVTHGATGLSPIPSRTQIPTLEPAPRVVDTTAAGDSFNAGVIAALVNGGDLSTALAAGHAMAIRVLGFEGAICPE